MKGGLKDPKDLLKLLSNIKKQSTVKSKNNSNSSRQGNISWFGLGSKINQMTEPQFVQFKKGLNTDFQSGFIRNSLKNNVGSLMQRKMCYLHNKRGSSIFVTNKFQPRYSIFDFRSKRDSILQIRNENQINQRKKSLSVMDVHRQNLINLNQLQVHKQSQQLKNNLNLVFTKQYSSLAFLNIANDTISEEDDSSSSDSSQISNIMDLQELNHRLRKRVSRNKRQ